MKQSLVAFEAAPGDGPSKANVASKYRRKRFHRGQVHEILAPFVEPISAAILVLTIGVLLGGLGFLLAYRSADGVSIRTSDKIQDDTGPVR